MQALLAARHTDQQPPAGNRRLAQAYDDCRTPETICTGGPSMVSCSGLKGTASNESPH